MKELIRTLTETYGPSGVEEHIRAVIRAEVEPYADDIRVDPLGSLVAHKQGDGSGQRIVLAAHMDEIGLMIKYIDEKGFARFATIGGVSALTCTGARVAFEDGTAGVIAVEEKNRSESKAPEFDQLYIDVGATSRKDCPVRVGDSGVFDRPFTAQGSRWIAKALDDRVGCAVLIETLRRLEQTPHDVHMVFSVQEETTLSGARTSTYRIDPDIAIAIDVTDTGDTPESHHMAVELGKGPAIKLQDWGMIAHPQVRDLMIKRAKKAKIPYQLEVLEHGTTDAAAMQLVRAGIPTGCLSIPCRYLHTPSEIVDVQDVEHSVKLLVALLEK